MPTLQSSVKNTTQKLAKALEDATELKIETRYIVVSGASADIKQDETGHLLARTVMKLDGDTAVVLPMTRNDAGELQTNKDVYDLHQNNVITALEYRAKLLTDLMAAIRTLG